MSKHTKERQIQVSERHNGGPAVTATETETHVFPVLPLPSAAEFAAFEIAVPGTGERILTLVEKQFEHRREQEIAKHNLDIAKQGQEAKQQDEDNKTRSAGIAVGLIVLLLFWVLALIFALMGRQMETVAAIVAPMIAFAIAVLKYTSKK
jgi:uncharacterized membrane protein